MNASDIPSLKLSVPWGASATGAFIRPVPIPSQIGIINGAASWTDGFPPDTFTPPGAGGYAPDGRDMNGVLNPISAWSRWYQAGGPVAWDSVFSTAIGGYPSGAVVASVTVPGLWWRSTANANTSNPDTGGANWLAFPNGRFLREQWFTAAGTFSPTFLSATSKVRIELVGGSGGSGGAKNGAIPGAGGSGAYLVHEDDASVFVGGTLVVGAAGAAGAATPTNGGDGGATTYGTLTTPGGRGSPGSSFASAPPESYGGGAGGALATGGNLLNRPGRLGGYGLWLSPSFAQAFGGVGYYGCDGANGVFTDGAGTAGKDGLCRLVEYS